MPVAAVVVVVGAVVVVAGQEAERLVVVKHSVLVFVVAKAVVAEKNSRFVQSLLNFSNLSYGSYLL